MSLIINPGTGPVENATEQNAWIAMNRFRADVEHEMDCRGDLHDLHQYRLPMFDRDGRFGFVLGNSYGERAVLIRMPGCDKNVTREGRPWRSPRLYLDGSSWLWQYAVRLAAEALRWERESK